MFGPDTLTKLLIAVQTFYALCKCEHTCSSPREMNCSVRLEGRTSRDFREHHHFGRIFSQSRIKHCLKIWFEIPVCAATYFMVILFSAHNRSNRTFGFIDVGKELVEQSTKGKDIQHSFGIYSI
jgi:hypothetical protein